MSEKPLVNMERYDQDFILAVHLLENLIESGNADTASLPECLAGLVKVIRANARAENLRDE